MNIVSLDSGRLPFITLDARQRVVAEMLGFQMLGEASLQ